ncbi:MAG: L-idonate 5-dehydrogenase [Novosphingobium sp.]
METHSDHFQATASGRAIVVHAPRQIAIEQREARLEPGTVMVRVHVGGICGSDLHYYLNGGFGAVRLKAPMVLGHEISGVVTAVGAGVADLAVGQRVAVNPSMPCGTCEACREGIRNHCRNMRFYGSAMPWPHVDGGFRDYLVCSAQQAVPISDGIGFAEAALAEPLAVCLHAANRAGNLDGKRVLVTGAGPIGCLMAAVAKMKGAHSVTVTDVIASARDMAMRLGADRVVDVGKSEVALAEEAVANGRFDVHFEAAGSAPALLGALAELAPMGICVLIGQGALAAIQVSSLIGREIDMRGSFRFDTEFEEALHHLEAGRLDVGALVTATLPANDAVAAFELAADKQRSSKVQLAFA